MSANDPCQKSFSRCNHGPLRRQGAGPACVVSSSSLLRQGDGCSIRTSPDSRATTDVRRTALRLILVSNRVAIPTESGAHRAGGLEVVLAPTLKRYEGVWFGWSGNVVPRAQVTTKTIEKSKQSYVLTDLSEEDYQEYYSGFANRVLWPILHYRIDLAEFTRRELTGYLRAAPRFSRSGLTSILPTNFPRLSGQVI